MRIENGVTNYYIYGLGLLYEITETATATNRLYYHSDYRGSIVAITDQNGNVTDRAEYSEYGSITYRSGSTDTPFWSNGRFGVQTDPNGLLYMRARYYNPYICRFINADPSGFAGGLNLYAYADGNPVSLVDPFGLGAAGEGANFWSWLGFMAETGHELQNSTNPEMAPFNMFREYFTRYVSSGYLRENGFLRTQWSYASDQAGANSFAAGVEGADPVTGRALSTPERWIQGTGGAVQMAGWVLPFLKPAGAARGVVSGEAGVLRARHFTSPEILSRIHADMALNPSSEFRGAGTGLMGVHVEVAPFGPAGTAPQELGAVLGGAYVEFNAPPNLIITRGVGPRNTAIIPTEKPLPLNNLQPTFVRPRPWWRPW
jgi:RHS repeat-associated protein